MPFETEARVQLHPAALSRVGEDGKMILQVGYVALDGMYAHSQLA